MRMENALPPRRLPPHTAPTRWRAQHPSTNLCDDSVTHHRQAPTGFEAKGSVFRAQCLGLRVQGSGFEAKGSVFRAQGFKVLVVGPQIVYTSAVTEHRQLSSELNWKNCIPFEMWIAPQTQSCTHRRGQGQRWTKALSGMPDPPLTLHTLLHAHPSTRTHTHILDPPGPRTHPGPQALAHILDPRPSHTSWTPGSHTHPGPQALTPMHT